MNTRIQQDWDGVSKANPQPGQGEPKANPQPAGGMGKALTSEGKAELNKLGPEKAGRVRDFLNRRG